MDLSDMRADYRRSELHRENLKADPFDQFALWFEEACRAQLAEPNAMSLATVSADGHPSLRTVLVKQYDARGFVFFTNLESRKSREIAANSNVALLFPWLALERQVTICGTAERISTAETLGYFIKRPIDSQLAAWASHQSSVITSRKILEMKWEEMKRKFSDGRVPLPSFWGGYRVSPHTFEFWQGRSNRLHDRFLYTRHPNDSWTIERLAP
jgi:pyridoxamine 5'-phosphate oxidase